MEESKTVKKRRNPFVERREQISKLRAVFLQQPTKIAPAQKLEYILTSLGDNNREHGKLPMELVCNILLRLPIEDLLCLMCVCWRDEIKELYFVNSHIRLIKNNNEANTSTSSLIVVFSQYMRTLMLIDFHSPEHTKVRPMIPNIPLVAPYLVGSCIGLLCFIHWDNINRTRRFSLYNPITGASKLVTELERLDQHIRYGFGYDCTSGDYKILCFAFNNENSKIYTCVYRLKSNSWNVNMDEPCPYQCNYKIGPSSMVLYNNALHFVTSLKKIIGFELGNEKFYEVPLPSDPLVVRYQPIELASLRGCLHLVRLTEIWIMKEYGVQESWTKLFRFSDANENGLFDRKSLGQRRIMPYAYSEDGREILVALDIRDNKILRLDLQSREFKKLEISGLPKDWTYWARFGYAMPWLFPLDSASVSV